MLFKRIFVKLILPFVLLNQQIEFVHAEDNACSGVYQTATRNFSTDRRSDSLRDYYFNQHCEQTGEVKSSSKGLDFNAVVKGTPLNLGLFDGDESESFQSFCKRSASAYTRDYAAFKRDETVVVEALRSFNDCEALSKEQFVIRHSDNHPHSFSISGTIKNPDLKPILKAIEYKTELATCHSNDFSLLGGKEELHGSVRKNLKGSFTITCFRIGQEGEGQIRFPRLPVSISTSSGDYNFVLQQDDQFVSVATALEAENKIDGIQKQLKLHQEENGELKTKISELQSKNNKLDKHTVLLVGPGLQGPLSKLPNYIVPVRECPLAGSDPATGKRIPNMSVLEKYIQNSCKVGYKPNFIGEIEHARGGACGQTVFQVDCVK